MKKTKGLMKPVTRKITNPKFGKGPRILEEKFGDDLVGPTAAMIEVVSPLEALLAETKAIEALLEELKAEAI